MISVGDFELIYDPSVGEAERWYINDHTFFRDHTGTWHLIGITHAEPMAPFDEVHLAHATAPDAARPVDEAAVRAHRRSRLRARRTCGHRTSCTTTAPTGCSTAPAAPTKTEYRIHLATSDDAWTWTRHPANPLIVDGFEARDPMVQRVGDRWVLYYTATSEPAGGHHVVVAAESDDLVHWSGRHIVYTDPMEGTDGRPHRVAVRVRARRPLVPAHRPRLGRRSSARSRETGRYDLARLPPHARARERRPARTSTSPTRSATIDAHAAEVVVDEHGDWWVTHCGWGQGGV